MAYHEHAYCTISGINTSSDMADEVWQFGIRLRGGKSDNSGWINDCQSYINLVAAPINAWFNASIFRSDCKATVLKVNNITTTGHYAESITHSAALTATGTGSPGMPAFVTTAVTLETGHTTGKARRGRVFPPFTAPLGSSQGVSMSSGDALAARDKIKALLVILNVGGTGDTAAAIPAVASKLDGTLNNVTGVSCNYVFDVQRRRKNRAHNVRTAVTPFP